ncbi:hypothetical protein H2200_011315 [Cladophialophora chaetospira]|uniref:Uncharacterized protein n=1 Tax=Cladophialophora chaetospira TaxID=386627 RepID=A0AA38X0E3_9EURO|nr:hypothetical protein H2200_011315 [Cladophialophora chaetospira]
MDPAAPNSPFKWEAASGLAELLAEYKIAAGTGPVSTRTRNRLEELPVNVPYAHQAFRNLDAGDAELEDEENDDDTDTVTDTTASTIDESERTLMPPPKLTKAEMRAIKKASKAAKSQSKAAKNQKKHVINVRTEDVDFVAKVLHGDAADTERPAGATHPLATDKTIEEVIARNMGFLSSIDEHKKMLLSSIAQRRRSDRDRRKSSSASSGGPKKRRFSERVNDDEPDDDEMEDLLVAALVKLGVDNEHARSSSPAIAVPVVIGGGAKKNGPGGNKEASCKPHHISSIVGNLKALVRDDLERFENEQRETCIRAGGFWRYVGRPVFERMTEIARELDWKTGMKLKEINGNMERDE